MVEEVVVGDESTDVCNVLRWVLCYGGCGGGGGRCGGGGMW